MFVLFLNVLHPYPQPLKNCSLWMRALDTTLPEVLDTWSGGRGKTRHVFGARVGFQLLLEAALSYMGKVVQFHIPYHPWGWYIYLHLVVFNGKLLVVRWHGLGVSKNRGTFPPQIIPFVHRVWNHYFHHPFWRFSPCFWKHPYGEGGSICFLLSQIFFGLKRPKGERAKEHVKKTIHTIVHEWGFRYLKMLWLH